MAIMTEFFGSHLVPRLKIGVPATGSDGYAGSFTVDVGTDGYAIDLRPNTVFKLTVLAQAARYCVLGQDEVDASALANLDFRTEPLGSPIYDDGYLLPLLDAASGNPNGHYLAANGVTTIATTPQCTKFMIKSVTSTATVILAPLGSFTDPPDSGKR